MSEGHATADQKVRQAIEKCINYDALAQVGTAGTAAPALGYLPKTSPYYNEVYTADERVVDVDGAKALLEEAGYGDGLDLTILIAASAPVGSNVAIFAQLYQQDYMQAVREVCLSTLFCILTLPLILGIADYIL